MLFSIENETVVQVFGHNPIGYGISFDYIQEKRSILINLDTTNSFANTPENNNSKLMLIFKNTIPNEMLFNLLDEICLKNEKHYLFNSDSYKKGVYKEVIQQFITDCTPYYHLSKRKYLEKKLSFNSFATILRQICNFNKIKYIIGIILYDL